jgi:hypothetical protein
MTKKLFTFQIIFVALLIFSSKVLAQSVCNNDVSITELKERLINLQKIRDDAERGIIESDRILMKAQEIILLARAKGDVKAGQIAEEAARKAEETKNKHLKTKQKAEEEIIKIKEHIQLAEKNNYASLKDLCDYYRKQVEIHKGEFKLLVQQGEELYKRHEEIIKEGEKAKQEVCEFLFEYGRENILTLIQSINIGVGKLGKRLQEIALTTKNEELYFKGANLREISGLNGSILEQIADKYEKLILLEKTGDWSADTIKKCSEYIQVWQGKHEYINKSLEEIEKELKEIAKHEETRELLRDLVIAEIVEKIEKYRGSYTKILSKSVPIIQQLSSLIDTSYHLVRAFLLEKEGSTYILLTDKMKDRYEEIKRKFDRDWKRLKECEELCKKVGRSVMYE